MFKNEINKLNPKLQFKLEIGADEGTTLNFLDLTIKIENGRLKSKIFRKECYTDAIIPNDSYHPWQHKMAGFHSMLNRLLKIPMNKVDYNLELESTILKIAQNNGYEKKVILKMLGNKRRNLEDKLLFGKENHKNKTKWISIPYI